MRRSDLRWTRPALAAALALGFAAGMLVPARADGGKHEEGLRATRRMAHVTALADVAQYDGLIEVHGRDRFATAAAFAQGFWTFEETIVVYVANGRSFPDALAAGGGTSIDPLGPILLTERDALPQPTVEAITALSPCYIVTLGGDSAISQSVRRQLDELAAYDEEFCQPA